MIEQKIAECVAAHTKKPLYPITCGDVGYKAEDVERNMENHFKLAHRWGCVLLLDEADVFLARRDVRLSYHILTVKTDILTRNSIKMSSEMDSYQVH